MGSAGISIYFIFKHDIYMGNIYREKRVSSINENEKSLEREREICYAKLIEIQNFIINIIVIIIPMAFSLAHSFPPPSLRNRRRRSLIAGLPAFATFFWGGGEECRI